MVQRTAGKAWAMILGFRLGDFDSGFGGYGVSDLAG